MRFEGTRTCLPVGGGAEAQRMPLTLGETECMASGTLTSADLYDLR